MSEAVLSTLCSICHAEPPKYKCPRCGARTCSMPCIQKHKARADCDGVRNPRAFLPITQLRTAAGVDHDFNFITSIERARQRSEKDLVEVRQLLSEKELRPKNEEKLFHKVWYGDELRHVPVQSQPHTKHGRPQEGPSFIDGFDKHVRRRLRYLDIETITMPKGMARQRDNKTAWNRRTLTINWQVEWLVHGALPNSPTSAEQDQKQPLRILCKSLEGTPLHTALASALDGHRGQQPRADTDNEADPSDAGPPPPRKKRKHLHNTNNNTTNNTNNPPTQSPTTTAWPAAPYPTQSTDLPGAPWNQTTTTTAIASSSLNTPLAAWQFFLADAANPRALIPLAATDILTGALAGRTVLEFPTIFEPHLSSPLMNTCDV
ncbi:hypothetical protein BT67DRAFT_435048 [Trichocladium antarcticum]|uniref:Box C/D snoRNA protein 1 n=1 Tax=Trichocladium antarcticum TaxID=1450529 RepID=A0AAN6UIA2_9PEZI|nr:hypothetical protein BT67DRAFT_435048 [Trichocladium antarcticum]